MGEVLATLLVCMAYLALMLWTRRRIIWAEDRGLLLAHLDKMDAELASQDEGRQSHSGLEGVRRLLEGARTRVLERDSWSGYFSGGAEEIRAWHSLHDAKLILMRTWPWAQLKARMEAAIVELQQGTGARRKEGQMLAAKLTDILERYKDTVPMGEPLEEARAELHRALRVIYSMEVEDDRRVTLWHNKTLWISCCSLIFILGLTVGVGRPQYFLLGALGAFVSKLVRLRTRGEAPGRSEYDYNWTSLFVAVPLGALMGWSGVLVAGLLRHAGMLGEAFDDLLRGSFSGMGLVPLSVAFLCGFSERLFDSVVDKGAAKVGGTDKPETAPQSGANAGNKENPAVTGAKVGAVPGTA